ncbi:phage tail tube protein [Caldimonas tepidiphila]|uniref:phage tail tube protein n=1 Tax=Caldimonas tepidiphila TaxID=2315841 RepID=UPI000E5A4139|nr:phage tail tube protein [Caldimonas tepidiphila]
MPRLITNTVVLAKVETTIGTDAAPTGAADAVLLADVSITPLDAQNIDRKLIRPFMGGAEQLVGPASVKATITVEMAGSGTAGTAPRWGVLLQACGMAEANLATPARNEYTPVSSGHKTVTVYYYDDGVLHKLVGAMGNPKFSFKVGERPTLSVDLIGLDGGVSAAANPSATLTAWRVPPAITKANVVDITLGATYAAGALANGTTYNSTGLELELGNQVAFTPMLNSEFVQIADRAATGSMQLDLTAAQEVSLMNSVKANTTQSLAMTVGTTAGNKLIVHAPAVQLINPSKAELNGNRLIGFDLRLVPVSGNDELRFACV